jgi:hypothetical protein
MISKHKEAVDGRLSTDLGDRAACSLMIFVHSLAGSLKAKSCKLPVPP